MQKTVVINTVALTRSLIGEHTPALSAFVKRGKLAAIQPIFPALTCSVQTTFLTGCFPNKHGIVGNGWYFREECEIKFWRQSNKLIESEKIWEMAKKLDQQFTCANLFWWFNMYSTVDYSVTPRPMYLADGRKIPDIYTQPADLRPLLQKEFGQFPLFDFWGPTTSIRSSRWIAEAAKWLDRKANPTLTLIYLPHLDYGLQRCGTELTKIAQELKELDTVCGNLIDFYETRGAQVIILAEYGIMPVTRPIHLNRLLREQGYLAVRDELGRELLDPGASDAFAVVDHQVAHIYINKSSRLREVVQLLKEAPGVAEVLDEGGKRVYQLDHRRCGDLVVISEPDAWFTYYYWLDDQAAPDFARTVDIHRKPGYDPIELFIDPKLKYPKVKIGWKLLKKQFGMRTLMDVISLDATLVRGSHGRIPTLNFDYPVFITKQHRLLDTEIINATDVCGLIFAHLTGKSSPKSYPYC